MPGNEPFKPTMSDDSSKRERRDRFGTFHPLAHAGDALMVCLAAEAAAVCATPVGIVSLLEGDGERFVGAVGLDVGENDCNVSMCALAIREPHVLVVEDTHQDARFQDLPWVVGGPYLRFFVGAPIFDQRGLPIGAVCVIHTQPHTVSSKRLIALQRLADVASSVLEIRQLQTHPLEDKAPSGPLLARQERLDALLLRVLTPRPPCVD